jgi:ATP-dependent RNA helicase DeaD
MPKPPRPNRPHNAPYGGDRPPRRRSAPPAPTEPKESPEPEVEATPVELPAFSELGLAEPIARAITELGFESPTPIQARAIPVLLSGRDLMGLAQTGTGKTAAFALPLLNRLDLERRRPQALVLAPTRELAVQVAAGIHQFGKYLGARVVPIYGGQPIDRQIRALQGGAQVVVGTPGRVLDHLRRGSLSLETVTFCALDEADEMLSLGFFEDIETILAELPEERQIAFFSATMPPRIAALTKRFLKDPVQIAIEAKRRTVDTTNQSYYEVPPGKKQEALARVLDMETPGPTIVFCRTRQETNDLADGLRLRGYSAEALHGDMGQTERDRVMRRFRDGQADLLVATDVAARGLDIETVTHVINYDVPWDVEQYIHRVGRTGRAGRTGDAITLIEPRELRQLKNLERLIGAQIKRSRIPTAADIAARRREQFRETLRDALQAGGFDGHIATVEELSEQFDPSEIAAAALHLLWQQQHGSAAEMADEMAAVAEQPEAGMTRLFIGMGRNENLRPGDLVGAIANEAGLPAQAIGAIDILDRTAFVEVPSDVADRVVEALRGTKIRNRKPRVDRAIPEAAEAALARRGGPGPRGDRGDRDGGYHKRPRY